MPIRKYKPEHIVTLLRQVEVGLANGKTTPPAVHRQQMGHSSAVMTARYTGEIPLHQVRQAFSGLKTRQLENMENEVAA